MMKNLLKNLLLTCLAMLPVALYAQNINRAELVDKTWYFVGMKCPEKVANGADGQYIHYFSSLKLTTGNSTTPNYGTYVRNYKDVRDNQKEKGSYSITTDDVGNTVLTLKKAKSAGTSRYMVTMVETNHLTLLRTDEGDKCNVTYAVSP